MASDSPSISDPECTPGGDETVRERIIAFLRTIGPEVRAGWIEEPTVLPGLRVDHGVLVYDPVKWKHPGDLLHEAGHLAVRLPEDRTAASNDLGADPAEEMLASALYYTAILHLGLPPAVLFHPEGYAGGSSSLSRTLAPVARSVFPCCNGWE
jgi:hypothetical protein